jgi:hypothetical protein
MRESKDWLVRNQNKVLECSTKMRNKQYHTVGTVPISNINIVPASHYLRSPTCLKWPRICSFHRNHKYIISSNMLYQWFVTRLTRRIAQVKWELLPLPEHLSSPPVFGLVRVAKSLVFFILLCISWFALLFLFICPLHCLSFFELGLMITDLVSSNFS